MKVSLFILLGLVAFEVYSRELLNDFSECQIKTQESCDAQSEYALTRINCYKKIAEDRRLCEKNVNNRIAKERNAARLKSQHEKNKIRDKAWVLLESKYESEAQVIINDSEKRKMDRIAISQKLKAYHSAVNRQVLKASEALRPRVDKQFKEAHTTNALLGKSLDEFTQKASELKKTNDLILKDINRIIYNFETYFNHYQSEINTSARFEENKDHYLKILEESKKLVFEVYDMQRALMTLGEQIDNKMVNINQRAQGDQGIKRGEFLVTELFKARKKLKEAMGDDREEHQIKVNYLSKYCLLEYQENPAMCEEH